MRIVVVEQDVALGLFIKKGLTVEGHDVSWAERLEDALGLVEVETPDLVVLDTSSEEGVDLLMSIQQRHRRAAILTLIRSNAVEERVRCLDLGADDCMAKPFSFHELTARCRAILRRQERSSEIVLTHGSLTLNRITRAVSVQSHPISLTAKEFRLLEFLLHNAGRCCSRGELLAEVFQLPARNTTNVVDVYINYLRKKLAYVEDSPVIMTVRGAGYRLARTDGAASGERMVGASRLHASA